MVQREENPRAKDEHEDEAWRTFFATPLVFDFSSQDDVATIRKKLDANDRILRNYVGKIHHYVGKARKAASASRRRSNTLTQISKTAWDIVGRLDTCVSLLYDMDELPFYAYSKKKKLAGSIRHHYGVLISLISKNNGLFAKMATM